MAQIQWREGTDSTLLRMLAEALPAYVEAAQKKKQQDMMEKDYASREEERKQHAAKYQSDIDKQNKLEADDEAMKGRLRNFFTNQGDRPNPESINEATGNPDAQGPMPPVFGPDYQHEGPALYGEMMANKRGALGKEEVRGMQQLYLGKDLGENANLASLGKRRDNALALQGSKNEGAENVANTKVAGWKAVTGMKVAGAKDVANIHETGREKTTGMRVDQRATEAAAKAEQARRDGMRHRIQLQLQTVKDPAIVQKLQNTLQALNDADMAAQNNKKTGGPIRVVGGSDEKEPVHNPAEERAETKPRVAPNRAPTMADLQPYLSQNLPYADAVAAWKRDNQ